MISLVPDAIKIGIAMVVGAAISFLPVYYYGETRGRNLERTAALQRSMELIKARSKTNEAVRNLSPAQLCIELGGLFQDGECR